MANKLSPAPYHLPLPHLPEEIVHQILSYIDEARDIAACSCVSRQWNQFFSLSQLTATLSFAHPSLRLRYLKNHRNVVPNIIKRMPRLQKLVLPTALLTKSVYSLVSECPTLRHLSLWQTGSEYASLLLFHRTCPYLETLTLCRFSLNFSSSESELLRLFPRLTSLELVDAKLNIQGFYSLCSWNCPDLVNLQVISAMADDRCDLRISMPNLEQCCIQLNTVCSAFHLESPKIKSLRLQGFSSITVSNTEFLQSLSIENFQRIDAFQFEGGFPALEYLSMTGCPLCWDRLSNAIGSVTNIKHLSMIQGDNIHQDIQSEELDIIDFFHNYPNLEKLQLNYNMLRVLSVKNAPHDTDHSYLFWNLKEVAVMLSSPSLAHAPPNIENLEFMIKSGENLKSIQLLIPIEMDDDHHLDYDKFLSSYPDIAGIQRTVMNITSEYHHEHTLCSDH